MVNLTPSVTAQEINTIQQASTDAKKELTARINSTNPFLLFDAVEGKEGKEIICPFCGSGAHDNKNTGITPTNANGIWLYHCFAGLDCEGTLTNIIAKANNLSTRGKDFIKVLAIGQKITGQFISDTTATVTTVTKNKPTPKKSATDITAELKEAQGNLSKFISARGGQFRAVSLKTWQQMKAGFLPNVYFPDAKKKLPAVVIPNDAGGVFYRAVDGKFYKNSKPTATTTVFLPDADNFNVILVEGQINAASIFEAYLQNADICDIGIIASGGTSGDKNVLARLQELKAGGKNFRIYIAFDNDVKNGGKGQQAADRLYKKLLRAGFQSCIIDITKQGDVDLNDVLQQEGGAFKLFDLVQQALPTDDFLRESTQKETLQETEESAESLEMYEVKRDGENNAEIDEFQLAKERVKADRLDNSELEKFIIPNPYFITNHGIRKIGKKEISTICPRPILIKEKFFNLEDQTYKMTLEYLTARKKWKTISPKGRECIFHKNRIVDLAAQGLPVTSGNAAKLVDFLFNLDLENENFTPLTYTVNRCGWYTFNDKQYFIDPRITNTVEDDDRKINITVDSASQTAPALKTKGTLEEWRRAYNLAANSTVARATIAASIAAPLLKILNERNFVFYVHGKTRSGKSTALYLGASAVGAKEMVRVFDGTNNGLTAMAAETNDYGFFVDEKQSADNKLKNDFQRWIYSDANGTERTRANKDGTVKPARTWQHITICNGETELLDDTATGGAHTRLVQVHAPDTLLDAETCKEIRQIIDNNYGHAFPLFVEEINKHTVEEIEKAFDFFKTKLQSKRTDILQEHINALAVICTADIFLNAVLGNSNGEINYDELLDTIPTIEEIDDTAREENIVSAFIAMKAAHFDGNANYNKDRGLDVFGKHKDGYLYIIAQVLNKYLEESGCNAKKVVNDLVNSGYFIPADKIETGNKPRFTLNIWINGKNQRCYKIESELSDDFPPESAES